MATTIGFIPNKIKVKDKKNKDSKKDDKPANV